MKRINIIKDIFKIRKENKVMRRKELLDSINLGIKVNKLAMVTIDSDLEDIKYYNKKDLEEINNSLHKVAENIKTILLIINKNLENERNIIEKEKVTKLIKNNLPKDIAEDILKCL